MVPHCESEADAQVVFVPPPTGMAGGGFTGCDMKQKQLTVANLAKIAGVSVDRIHNAVRDGELRNISPAPRSLILIDSDEATRWIRTRRKPGRPAKR